MADCLIPVALKVYTGADMVFMGDLKMVAYSVASTTGVTVNAR